MACHAAPPGPLRRLAVPFVLVLVVAAYAAVHAVLLRGLAESDRAVTAARDAAGLPTLAPPESVLAWLPVASTLRFAALAGLAVALAAAGRRWAVLLPAGVPLVGLADGARLPLPLDSAWSSALWLGGVEEVAARVWAGTALDLGLLLMPAGVCLLVRTPGGRPLPARAALLASVPLLAGLVALREWTALTGGAPVKAYLPAALLVLGAALLATGTLGRRTVLAVAVVLPALAAGGLYWQDTTPLGAGTAWGRLVVQPDLPLAALAVSLTTVTLVLGAPSAARWWRAHLRRPAVLAVGTA